jgi:hypothetical protein
MVNEINRNYEEKVVVIKRIYKISTKNVSLSVPFALQPYRDKGFARDKNFKQGTKGTKIKRVVYIELQRLDKNIQD